MVTPGVSKKDFSLSEVVLDGHDELEVSQTSLLPSSGRTGNEIGPGGVSQVWSAGAGLIHLHTHTRAHTHSHKKQGDSAEGNARTCRGSWGVGGEVQPSWACWGRVCA